MTIFDTHRDSAKAPLGKEPDFRIPGLFSFTHINGVKLKYSAKAETPPRSLSDDEVKTLEARVHDDYLYWAGKKKLDGIFKEISEIAGPNIENPEQFTRSVLRAAFSAEDKKDQFRVAEDIVKMIRPYHLGKNDVTLKAIAFEVISKSDTFFDTLKLFHQKRVDLIGGRNLQVDEQGVLTGEWTPVPQPRYASLAKKGARKDVLDYSRVIGTAGIIVAKDSQGRRYVQVQARNPFRNYPHGGNPGCSPAGMLRQKPELKGENILEKYFNHLDGAEDKFSDVDESHPIENVHGEGHLELGLVAKHLSNIRLLGSAYDEQSPHDELLYTIEPTETIEELDEISIAHTKKLQAAKNQEHPHNFSEPYAWIPADSESLKAFCLAAPYSPGTHLANYVAFTIQVKKEELAEEGVHPQDFKVILAEWASEFRNELTTARDECNKTIAEHYLANPDEFRYKIPITEVRQIARHFGVAESSVTNELIDQALEESVIKPPYKDEYDPRRIPSAQGLPDAPDVFLKLREQGIDIKPGTMHLSYEAFAQAD